MIVTTDQKYYYILIQSKTLYFIKIYLQYLQILKYLFFINPRLVILILKTDSCKRFLKILYFVLYIVYLYNIICIRILKFYILYFINLQCIYNFN